MNDLEISRALALAVGWLPHQVAISTSDGVWICTNVATLKKPARWRWFDYRDPAVIWPIADRYDCFPIHEGLSWRAFVNVRRARLAWGNTPAKAVALAVIRSAA